MNMDEYTPTTTPIFMAKAKLRTTPVPKIFIAMVTTNKVIEVSNVRASVSLREMLTMRGSFLRMWSGWWRSKRLSVG